MDGWTVMAAHSVAGFGAAFLIGIAFHKLPEGIALGVIARASMSSRLGAIVWCAVAESATLAGGGFETLLAPHLNPQRDPRGAGDRRRKFSIPRRPRDPRRIAAQRSRTGVRAGADGRRRIEYVAVISIRFLTFFLKSF